MTSRPFITCNNISLRLSNNKILENTYWEIKDNENWVILGPNGAGKSTLVKAFFGEVPVVAGRIIFHFLENKGQRPANQNNSVGYVAPELARKVFEKESFQEEVRHFAGRVDQRTTLLDIVVDGQDSLLDPSTFEARFSNVVRATHIDRILQRDINALSTGEMSRALIARALMKKPKLLILDEPFDGLDKKSRNQLADTINDLMQGELRIILITQRFEEIVPGITHILYVKDGRIHSSGPRKDLLTHEKVNEVFGITPPIVDPPTNDPAFSPAQFSNLNRFLSKSKNFSANNESRHKPLIEMNKVVVKYGEVVPLSDFTWCVQRNENWIIFGPEGAGKTTILKLIVGENLQSYANDIHLFGKKRGEGQSIWELRRNIGFVSSDLQSKYANNVTLRDVVLSGFYDTIGVYRQCTIEEIEIVDNWLSLVGLSDFSEKPFGILSHGQRQLALVARAMVKVPRLLLLDEPFNGLDISRRIRLSEALNHIVRDTPTHLVYATHDESEILPCMTHILSINRGKIQEKRPLQKSETTNLSSAHQEIPDGHSEVSRLEMRDFVQDQRNRGPKAKRLGTEHPKRCEEIKGLRGDVLEYVACLPCRHRQAQTRQPIDEEIGQKDHFRMETRYNLRSRERGCDYEEAALASARLSQRLS